MKIWLLAFSLLFSGGICLAQTLDFQWDPDTEAITGFHLYQSRTSGVYTTPVATFQPGTLTGGSIPKPTQWGRYYYVLSAFGFDNSVSLVAIVESGFSNEISIVITPRPPKLNTVTLAILKAPITGIEKLVRVFTGKKTSGFRVKVT